MSEVNLFCLNHLNNSAFSDQEFNVLVIWLICVYPSDREEKYNISSSSVDKGTQVWVGKDFLEK